MKCSNPGRCLIAFWRKNIKIFIVLKHLSRVPSFDDLSNFVIDVTVNVVTHYVETTLTIMTFSFTGWKQKI